MRKRKNFSATFFCPETIPGRYNAYSALIRTPSDCLQGQIRTYPQKMSPLTTITILVYELIKVNPTTRTLLAVRRQQHRQASRQKKAGKLLMLSKKKSSQQLSDENRHGRHHAHSTAKPLCKMQTSTNLIRHRASRRFDVEKGEIYNDCG